MIRPRATLALAITLWASSCVQVNFLRDRQYEPIPDAQIAQLTTGTSTLADCLEMLGAPNAVSAASDKGVWLVWGWGDDYGWGLSASVPLWRLVSGSFNWASTKVDLDGLVLRLDESLVLREIRRGKLSAIFSGGKDVNRRLRARTGD